MALHLSDTSEQVKRRAIDLTRKWKHFFLSTEHYLCAACIEDPGCERWLTGQGLSIEDFEEAVLKLVPEGDETPIWEGIPESPRMRRVLTKLAQAEAN